jgi:NAD(P)H-hydrate epimerase
MKRLDEISINEYGIPGTVLMENAGLSVVEEIESIYFSKKHASVICGTGNNGGDGFVIARHLHNRGWKVNIFVCGETGKIKGDALLNLLIAKKIGIPVYTIDDDSIEFCGELINDSSIIVDALLGIGFRGELKGFYKVIIGKVNESEACVVSVDIPSGLDADTGFFSESCVMADFTVTFQIPKVGLLINDGPKVSGNLKIKNISIPKAAIDAMRLDLNLLEQAVIKSIIPVRDCNTHKGSFGRVFVVACSKGMEGSGIMSSRAALRSGAGIVILGLPESLQKLMCASTLEIMTKGLEDRGTGMLNEECIPKLLETTKKSSSLLIGPGLTDTEGIRVIMTEIIKNCTIPTVIDADGLNAISSNPSILKKHRGEIVITPHPGEMARLCGCSNFDIQQDRLGYAKRFAKEFDVIVVLKGYRTIIALPDGTAFINPTGNPGMATAGSGDVLAGIIAGFAAQKLKLADAVLCGVYIHGAAGDRAADKVGEYGLTAGDIIENISHTIENIAGK